jgi:hypothetical protein
MAQIGTVKLETQNSGVVDVPVFATGDSASGVYEFVRVETASGTGFIPVTDPADATYPYLRVQSQNNGIVAVTDTAGSAIPDSGISRFEFADDSDTSVLVDSWGNNDGTLSGASYVTDGVEFDGTDDFGDFPAAVVPFSGGEWSIAIKIRSTSTASLEYHFGVRNSSTGHNYGIAHNSGDLQIFRFDGSAKDITNSTDYRDGSDHWIIIAEDSNGAEAYADGSSVGTAPAGSFDLGGDQPSVARRGGSGGEDSFAAMTALDYRFYNKRLSGTEASNLSSTGSIDG